ncbi:MAG: cytidine deaminase [Clostridia bacterium]|nr:cytidine deaminase [Clostridia bacterium]MDR3643974.1 cytidine deaminase [Clostridia bacterium]
MTDMLAARARQARANAYAPYSHFQVGAALLCDGGEIFTGCNMENASFGATICAERAAAAAAVCAGKRRFEAICIAAGDETVVPCGLCRQVLCEFGPDMLVLCCSKDAVKAYTLRELLPDAFSGFTPGM